MLTSGLMTLALLGGLPPAHPPGPIVAGVQVRWPVPATTTRAPGETLAVKVASKRRKVLVSLVRVSAAGRPLRTVAARTLRTGTFSAAPPGYGHYALRLTVANRRYWSWIEVPAPAPAPVPVATPAPPPVDPCLAPAIARPALVVSRPTARPGEILEYRITNLNASCFRGTRHFLERLLGPEDGYRLELVPGTDAAPTESMWDGDSLVQHIPIPAGAPAGEYRVRAEVDGRRNDASEGGSYTAAFYVTS